MQLDRAMLVLETLAAAGRPVSAVEVQRASGLPRPSCYRLLQGLAEHGMIDVQTDTGRYTLGGRLRRLVAASSTVEELCQAAGAALKDAVNDLNEAVFLSRARGGGVEIIHVETPSDPAVSYVHPGLGFRPMHACSCSKVIAAFASEKRQHEVVKGRLKSYTDKTSCSRESLLAEFAMIRQRGYAECVEEIETGVSSVAVPVRAQDGTVAFSVGAIGSIQRFKPRRRASIARDLSLLAQRVETAISLRLVSGSGASGSVA